MNTPKLFVALILALLLNSVVVFAWSAGPAREGEIIADIGFDPEVNGFGFRNYGKNPDFDETDLTADDMIRMFGAENVCIEGSTARDCVLYETADRWIEQSIKKMEGGHCDGFSMASLRTFVNRPFKGRKNPAGFQQGAEHLFDLRKTQTTSNYIAFYHALQYLSEVYSYRSQQFKKKPSEILEMIEDAMHSKKEYYALLIYVLEDGKLARGHSIVPIAIEDLGGDNYRIDVYDNNYPGVVKYVTMNTKAETWRYHTANNPSETARDYVGNAATHTLSLHRLSDRFRNRYECSFCDDDEDKPSDDEDAIASTPNIFMNASYTLNPSPKRQQKARPPVLTISSSGDVDLLIADPAGKRIGYDWVKKVRVNEIPGATENVSVGDDSDVDIDTSPEYVLPLNPANKKPYKINLHGTDSKYVADLQIYGAGFVVGFEDIDVDKNESLNMTATQDGRELTFTASADGETPSIYISTDNGKNKPSYDFEIGGISLEGGHTVSVKLDPDKGLIYFKDDDGAQEKYNVKITRTNPNGTVDVFNERAMDIGKGNNYVLNYGAWDGKGSICVKDDEKGDFDKDECKNIENQKPAKKPNE